MLEKIDLTKTLSKKEYKRELDLLAPQLAKLQRIYQRKKIPVMIVFEGFGASGKGTLINKLIQLFDPRGFRVHAIKGESEEEIRRPFLWRFWTKIPAHGRIAVFDRSWYRRVLIDRFDKITTDRQLIHAYNEIVSFETVLAEDGMLIIKLFLVIDKKEQKKRFDRLLQNKATAWRVSKGDLKRHRHFREYAAMNEEMLEKTDTDKAPWTLVEATDKKYAALKVIRTVTERMNDHLKQLNAAEKPTDTAGQELPRTELTASVLSKVDLSQTYSKAEYKQKRKALQKRLAMLHSELYRRRIPLILGFEGWDAGGKGGAIRRLTESLDPRGYTVNPTAAPNDLEKAHHYLWRFWNRLPKSGHIAIFDRTWYGRVMVERIEGFCSMAEWKRAYHEINEMEASWQHDGAIVLKFWMQIDKDEQERRFKARMENPEKQWKITDEDWRNREKWDLYQEAVDEMLIRTSTTYAPWIIVAGNCKYYARIKVLEEVIKAIERRLAK